MGTKVGMYFCMGVFMGLKRARVFCFSGMCLFFTPFFAVAGNNAAVWNAKCQNALSGGKTEKAVKACERAVNLAPTDAGIHLLLARSYDANGEFSQAIATYERTLTLKPDAPAEVYNDKGVALAKTKDYRAALQSLTKAVHIAPDYALAHYNLGKVFFALGQKTQARAQFQKLKDMGQIDMAQALWEQIYR